MLRRNSFLGKLDRGPGKHSYMIRGEWRGNSQNERSENITSVLDEDVSILDALSALFGVVAFFGVFSLFVSSLGGIVGASDRGLNNLPVGVNFIPSVIKPPGGNGGGGNTPPYPTYASMEFSITNNTPWWSFWYIVHSKEVVYFNVTNHYEGGKIIKPPSVNLDAKVSGFPGGEVISKNGPHNFNNYTNSNGTQVETFLADVMMVNYALVYGESSPLNNMYTNIVVGYKVMGSGHIYIKYWVKYNGVLSAKLATYMAITNAAERFAASGGG